MESFIPNASEPPVPVPFGQLTVAVAESLTPSHHIAISNPILLSDFPDTPQGAVAYMALQRVSEILSHGFLSPSNSSPAETTPSRELWLSTVSQILVHTHNSIRRTHGSDPLPNSFSGMSPEEKDSFQLLAHTISSLNSFFSNRFDNLITDPDEPDTEAWEICLRCLEECQYPIDKAGYESVLMSCTQNIHAAHRTIINDKLRTLSHEMDEWVDDRRAQIETAFIDAVISDDLSYLHNSTDRDPCLDAWASHTVASFTATAKRFMAQEVLATTVEPILIESLQAAKVKVDTKGEAYLDNYIRDERVKAKAAANCDALIFYNDTLQALKAEATERLEREIAKFKSSLKVKNEERKAALLADFAKWAPTPSITSSSSAVRSSHRKTRVDRSNSVAGPSPGPLHSRLSSRSASRSRSLAPSPDSVVPGRSPDQMMPRASPVVDLPPTRANTEPPILSIYPPPMNVSVGPPSNSFETAMVHVDTMVLTAFKYPRAPSAFEPQGPPNTQNALPAPLQEDKSFSSIDPHTSSIESLIRGMSESFLAKLQETSFATQSQFSELSNRLQKLEQPVTTYSPSAVATPWCPLCSSAPDAPPGHYDHIPISEDLPTWFYGDAQMGDAIEPGWLDSYLQGLYFDHLSLPSSHVPTDSQHTYLLTLPGLFTTYCRRFQLSPDHHLNQYDVLPFWEFVDEYKKIQASGRNPLLFESDPLCGGPIDNPDEPEWEVLHPLSSNPPAPGSIRLFPPRAPSQPPIVTLNAPSAPLRAPVSDHARGWARPSVAQEVPNTTVTASAPAAPQPPPDSSLPWKVMGAGNKPLSFASVASSGCPTQNPPPIKVTQRPAHLTDNQLIAMMRNQIVRNYEVHFNATVRTRGASKESLIFAYKHARSTEAAAFIPPKTQSHASSSSSSQPTNRSRPCPHPVSTTEFTILRDPSTIALQGPHADPASLVCSLQTSPRQARPGGAALPFNLLSGRWSSQLSANFVLTFAGQPSNDDIL